jgi:hypothetical protein
MGQRKLWSSCILGCGVLLVACASSISDPTESASAESDDALLTRHCETTIIASALDLAAARACREIDGDLVLRAPDLEAISADAMPHLRRITGSLISTGGRPLREIVLPELREVGTGRDDLLEIGFDATSLERIELPALKRVNGSLGIVGLGSLHTLDLSALEVVSGELGLVNLPELTDLRIGDQIETGGGMSYEYLCELPAFDLPDAPATNDGDRAPQVRDIGCCTYSATQCESSFCMCP